MRQNQAEGAPSRRWRFGRVEFDERDLSLSLDGRAIDIEPKPLRVLQYLLANAGNVVAKDALVRAVWPGRIITDSALAKSIARLRDAIGDREQVFIRTHHGYGYRLVAPLGVEVPGPRDAAQALSEAARDFAGTPHESAKSSPRVNEAEHRPLTVLCCDLVGSTQLAESLDPEAYRELLIEYRRTATDICARYEGQIPQQLGDGLLMIFGYPTAHDDDAERAVRCACDLVAAFAGPQAQLRLSLRIGVHSGKLTIGQSGAGKDLLATGTGLHLASRLQALAEPDTILMSEATFRLVPGLFVTRDFGEQEIRGLSEPVRVHQAIHPSGVRSRLAAASRLTPFVGRESEIQLLDGCWHDAVNGEGRAILFSAEPGLGKSRLLMEIRARLAGRPYSWHECRADALNRHSAFHPLVELLRSGLALKDGDDEALRLSRLEQGFADVQLDPAQAVPLIGPLLGIAPTTRYPPSPLAPAQKRRQTLALLAEWIERLANQQPLIVAFEDLHWIDESSLNFIGALLERLPRLPVLLVMTARLEFSAPWAENQTLCLRMLEPLPLWDVERMLGSLTGGAKLAPALSLLVFERAGGVPLFVEEFTRSLIESGQIVEREGQLAPRVPLGDLAIPVSLHGLLLARLDRLGVARELIQIAAVIGREVPLRLLLLVAGLDEARLRERLARLVASGLLHGRPDDSYVFKHALIRDSAYETLLKSARERLHGSIALALEAHFPERAAAEPEVLAAHFESARQLGPAVRWYKTAAEKAVGAISLAEAVAHARHALELLAQLSHNAARDALELDLCTTLGNSLITTIGYGHPEVGRVFARVSALCETSEHPTLVCRALGNIWFMQWHRGEYVPAKATADRIVTLGGRIGDDAVRALGLMERCWARLNLGELVECVRDSEQGLALLTPSVGASMLRMAGHDGFNFARIPGSHAEWLLGYADRAAQGARRMVELAEQGGHPHTLGWALFASSTVLMYRREPMLILEPGRRGIELSERHGYAEWLSYTQQYLGLAMLMLGRLDEGRELLDASNTARRAHHTVGFTSMHKAIEAEQWRLHGRVEEARTALAEGFAYLRRSEECHWAAELHRVQGELHFADGDAGAAEVSFDQALSVSRAQGARALELRAATSLARQRQRQGRAREAVALLQPVYTAFTEGLDTPDLQDAAELLGSGSV